MKAVLSAVLFAMPSLAIRGDVAVTGGVNLGWSATTLSSYGWAEMLEPTRAWSLRGRHYIYDAVSSVILSDTGFDLPCTLNSVGLTTCKWSHTATASGAYGRCYRATVAAAAFSAYDVQLAYNAFTSAAACPLLQSYAPGDCTGGGPLPTSDEPALADRGDRPGPERVALDDGTGGNSAVDLDRSPTHSPIRTQGAGGCGSSPILIDLTGDDFRLSDEPVSFDLDADGVPEKTNWTAPRAEVAFLVLDRNGNGTIDDGTELFGDHTLLSTGERLPYGYAALAEYDLNANGGNFDGYLSAEDAVWSKLRLWIDRNHDGKSQPDELETLDQAGILRLLVDYEATNRKDRLGNRFIAKGKAWRENRHGEPKEIATWDVVFARR